MAKAVQRFQTSVLFDMVTGKYDSATPFNATLEPVIAHIFPGIDYWERQQGQIIKDIVAPQIAKQHSSLRSFNSAADAVQALGVELPVEKVQRCKGFEWMYPNAVPKRELRAA